MNTQPDFEELLSLLSKHRVEYMVVGGYAVAYHGYPRFTKDLDVFYKPSEENVRRLKSALIEFGFTSLDVEGLAFEKSGEIICFGVEPVRVDLINQIDGITFSDAVSEVDIGNYGLTAVVFIGKRHLVLNKKATSRLKDKVDAEELEKI